MTVSVMLTYGLFAILAVFLLLFLKNVSSSVRKGEKKFSLPLLIVGFCFGFLDTLGVGGFAPTLSYLKHIQKIRITEIADILLLSFAVPTVLQTFIFVSSVSITPRLLILGITVPVLGYIIVNHIKSYINDRHIKLIVGSGLILSGSIALVQNLGFTTPDHNALLISPPKEIVIYVSVFFFGGLTNFGIGNFSPTLILFELLGLDPHMGFPIMMGACALIMLISGLKEKTFTNMKIFIPLSISTGMIVAVPLGVYFIHNMNLRLISWLVILISIFSGLQTIIDKKEAA
ncbi:TSUP family transporter [Acetobacteraceae bacterium ESL0709]|nr:TSUP family transporter [Acetobacteraceae bacterium ESL0697]MDF7677895.1 TSUP family transporter [Acetobacteraceae bacterium ESL0709]